MNKLGLKIFTLGDLSTNCYIIYDKDKRSAFIVDIPWPCEEAIQFIKQEKLEVNFIALTHGHFDHIWGLYDLHFPFGIHKEDEQLLKSSVMNGSIYFNFSVQIDRKVQFFLEEEKPIEFDSLKLEVLHTPGHTPGSVCLKLDNWLFSGDTIFLGTVGRTDVGLGSHESLIKSIKDKILPLPKDTIVYPGHGGPTTVGKEIEGNPFLKE